MGPWTTSREVEKPKTLTGKRQLAVVNAETVYVQVMQTAEAARLLDQDSVYTVLIRAAGTIRSLISLMPGGQHAVDK